MILCRIDKLDGRGGRHAIAAHRPRQDRFVAYLVDHNVLAGRRTWLDERQSFALGLEMAGEFVENDHTRSVGGEDSVAIPGQDQKAARSDKTAFGKSVAKAVHSPRTEIKGERARGIEQFDIL